MKKELMLIGQFDYFKNCKHSVHFKPADNEAAQISSGVYIFNKAVESLGNPKSIEVKVEGYSE